MLHRKNSILHFVFGIFLAWLGAAYAEPTQLSKIFPEQNISEAWTVNKISRDNLGDVCVVDEHPKAKGRFYTLPRDGLSFDCAVLLKSDKKSGLLGGILDECIEKGFSTHYIMGQDGALVEWVNPLGFKAQGAGPWNGISVQILLLTHEDKSSDAQNRKMKILSQYLRKTNTQTDVKYLGSHSEARGSGEHGVIKNVDAIRKSLDFRPLSEKRR